MTLWAYVVMRFGIKVGNFVPKNYVQQVVENSDFRKYDDGLRMILDCTEELERALAELLAKAASSEDRALRPAPAGRGDDDLLHAVGDAQRSRPLHRRRPRRLCVGGDRAEGDGGVGGICGSVMGSVCRRNMRRHPHPSPPPQVRERGVLAVAWKDRGLQRRRIPSPALAGEG